MKTAARIAHKALERYCTVDLRGLDWTEALHVVRSAVLYDRRQHTLNDAVAEALEDRGDAQAAQVVRDTADDHIWQIYFGPMLDALEQDYEPKFEKVSDE